MVSRFSVIEHKKSLENLSSIDSPGGLWLAIKDHPTVSACTVYLEYFYVCLYCLSSLPYLVI